MVIVAYVLLNNQKHIVRQSPGNYVHIIIILKHVTFETVTKFFSTSLSFETISELTAKGFPEVLLSTFHPWLQRYLYLQDFFILSSNVDGIHSFLNCNNI